MSELVRVALVSCGAQKRPERSAARDLYTGSVFTAARRDVENRGLPWWIVSAMWALVHPEQELDPYEFTVRQIPAGSERDRWAERVASWLGRHVPLSRAVVELHAGADYVTPLRPALEALGAIVEPMPPGGLPLGPRLAWYAARRPENIVDRLAATLTATPPADIEPAYVRGFFVRHRDAIIAQILDVYRLPAAPRRTTAGTRVSWATLGEWLSGWSAINERHTSAARYSALHAHVEALSDDVVEGGTLAQLDELEGVVERSKPPKGRRAGHPTIRIQDAIDRTRWKLRAAEARARAGAA